jgi:hypothetical protein
MWYSMLYSASMLLLLAVQNYKAEVSILPICENQSTNLKAEMKSHRQHDNFIYLLFSLTFKNCVSYIQDGRTATLQMLHFMFFFFSTNIST